MKLISLLLVVMMVIGTWAEEEEHDDDGFFDESKHPVKWLKCKASDKYPLDKKLNHTWYDEKSKAGWYYVMANKWHVMTMTKSLTGADPKSHHAIKNACFSNQRKDMDDKKGFLITGYKDKDGHLHKAGYTCDGEMGDRSECKATHDSTNEEWASNRGTTDSVVVWSDNKKYVLNYRCTRQTKTWALRSTDNENVDDATKAIILEKIKNDGFKPENAVEIPRKHCEKIKRAH